MLKTCLQWVSSNSRHNSKLRSHPQHLRLTVGNAHAELRSAAISVRTAAKKPQPQPAAGTWSANAAPRLSGNSVPSAVLKKPADENGWTCSCGALNKGKFCQSCGAKKPEGAPLYRCDKCGWEPEDPTNPPKFCPECGDIFDDNDKNKTAALRGAVHIAERLLRQQDKFPLPAKRQRIFFV